MTGAAPPLDRVVAVFDLEWTSWEGAQARNWSGPGEEQEIVEIGAVKLDGRANLREIASFSILARPRLNPVLSDYFIGLTGIDQAAVDARGAPFPAAFAAFRAFLDGDGQPAKSLLSFARDPAVLHRNCALAGIAWPFADADFVNVRPLMRRFASLGPSAPFSACDLPALLGFPPPAGAHRALGDARCIAEALRLWSRNRS